MAGVREARVTVTAWRSRRRFLRRVRLEYPSDGFLLIRRRRGAWHRLCIWFSRRRG